MKNNCGFASITLLLAGVFILMILGGLYSLKENREPTISSPLPSKENEVPSQVIIEQESIDDTKSVELKKAVIVEPVRDADIRILSPNGGETYRVGDVVSLVSKGGRSSDTGHIENGYFLVDAVGEVREIGYDSNTFSWRVDTTRDGRKIMPGTYKIRVTSSYGPCPDIACAQTIQDESDRTFSIVR
jgi:hypothetical protein